jgi:hypothetical protein
MTPVPIRDCHKWPDGSQHPSTAQARTCEQDGVAIVACSVTDEHVEAGQREVVDTEECDKLTGGGKTPQVVCRVHALGFICDDSQPSKRRSGAGTHVDRFTASHEQQFDPWRVPKRGKCSNAPIKSERIWIANRDNDRQRR